MEELKACPFCGRAARIRRVTKGGCGEIAHTYLVECSFCRVSTPTFESIITQDENGKIEILQDGAAKAAQLWNERTAENKETIKSGKWLYNPDSRNDDAQAPFVCSECGAGAEYTSKFCPE